MLDSLLVDTRHAIRALRRSPGFVLIAATTFVVTVGASTTIFSLLNAIVLRTISAAEPNRLVIISLIDAKTRQPGYVYLNTFEAFRTQQRSFSALSMYSGGAFYLVESGNIAIDVGLEGVSPDYFSVVGITPAVGRILTDVDTGTNAPPVAVITDRLWERLFGRDPRSIGTAIQIDGIPVTVIGVTAAGFYGLQFDGGADVFVPVSALRTFARDPKRPIRAGSLVGRLRSGATIRQARAEVLVLWPPIQSATIPTLLSETERRTIQSQYIEVQSGSGGISLLRRQYGGSLAALAGVAAILAMLGCANLASLVLTRALRRQQQVAVRLALGASHARLTQQVAIEGVLVALIGLGASLPIAWWLTQLVGAMLSVGRIVPLLRPMTPDVRVLLASVAITIAAGLFVSVLPVLRIMNSASAQSLESSRTVVTPLGRSARMLAIVQVALSMVLLVGAGLFVATLERLRANDQPFRGRPVLWTRLSRNPGDRTTFSRAYWQQLIQQLSALPGVTSASLSFYFPAYLPYPGVLPTDTYSSNSDANVTIQALTESASPRLFDTFGIPRHRGRDFTWDDDERAPLVAIVNESLATRLFGSPDIIGHHLRVKSGATESMLEVVGTVVDVPIGNIRDAHQPVVFRPLLQDSRRTPVPMAHVRAGGSMTAVLDGFVRVIRSQGHHFVRGVFTLDQWTDYALVDQRLIAGVAVGAALVAGLLGCLGIYGLLAYRVESRTREIGVRIALGAPRRSVVWSIVRDSLIIIGAGIALGVPAAIFLGKIARSQLYGIAPNDPYTIVNATLIFMAVGAAATWLPAKRAASLDPVQALRYD